MSCAIQVILVGYCVYSSWIMAVFTSIPCSMLITMMVKATIGSLYCAWKNASRGNKASFWHRYFSGDTWALCVCFSRNRIERSYIFFCQVYTKHFLERNPTLTRHQKLIWYEDLQQGPECTQPWSLNTLTLSSSLLVMMLLNPPAPDSDYFVLNTWSFNSSLHYVCAVNWFGD